MSSRPFGLDVPPQQNTFFRTTPQKFLSPFLFPPFEKYDIFYPLSQFFAHPTQFQEASLKARSTPSALHKYLRLLLVDVPLEYFLLNLCHLHLSPLPPPTRVLFPFRSSAPVSEGGFLPPSFFLIFPSSSIFHPVVKNPFSLLSGCFPFPRDLRSSFTSA